MHNTRYQEFAEPMSAHASCEGSYPAVGEGADACQAALTFFREYAKERPEVVALWTFGIGFVVGWKLKPW